MPFTTKFVHLGNTRPIRLPHTLHTHALHIAHECDRICGTHDEAYALHILDKVIEGLESVP